jgi:hypothetical protein
MCFLTMTRDVVELITDGSLASLVYATESQAGSQ